MSEHDLLDLMDESLADLGADAVTGEEFERPPLVVLRYYTRIERLGWLPFLGKALGVVAVVRRPRDIAWDRSGLVNLQRRLAQAVNGRFPPRPLRYGLAIGLTVVIIGSEAVNTADDALLAESFPELRRMRAVALGLVKVDLQAETMAFALRSVGQEAFPEASAIIDILASRLRRFVPYFRDDGP